MSRDSVYARMTHRAPKSVVSEEELRKHAATVEIRHLLLAAVHVTGDLSLLDRFAHRLPVVESALERALLIQDLSTEPPELREEVVAILCSALTREDQPEYFHPADADADVLVQMATVALGTPVDEAQMLVCMEQGGFVPDQRVIAPTTPAPPGFELAIIGAGMAGIDAAVKAATRGIPFTVYETAEEIGGIWWSQRYPGVAVDTPSLYYSLSYEVSPHWTKLYPLGEEYRLYLNRVVEKYDIRPRVRCNSTVLRMEWLEEEHVWELTILDTVDGTTRTARHAAVVTGAGQFTGPKYPADVSGRETFAGEQVHTGVWRDLDLEGKRVAVVGVGAAGVQVVGALAPKVEHMTVFHRQAHWIMPNLLPDDGNVPESELWLRLNLPFYLHWGRFITSYYANVISWEMAAVDREWVETHPGSNSISATNHMMMEMCLEHINSIFGEGSDLARKLTPDFPFFGKRPVRDTGGLAPGGYYWAYLQPHVDLVTDHVTRVVPEGIVTADGTLHPLDVIVWATGMTIDLLSTIEIVGRDGALLTEVWGENDARTYLGGTVPGFPNLFVNDGPNTGIGAGGGGHNFSVELLDHYVFECLQLMFEQGARAIEVTQEAHDRHNELIEEAMQQLVWTYDNKASTYYRNAAGRVIFQSPFPAHELWTMSQAPDAAAFVLHTSSLAKETAA